MQPVLFVDWEDGFGRLQKIFFSLYPQVFGINKLNVCSNKQHALGCSVCFYPFYSIRQQNLFLSLLTYNQCVYNQ